MKKKKERVRVLLTGASGSMGSETFRQLWEERDSYELVLLLRPSSKNRKLFRPYEKEVKIVWGDLLVRQDVALACEGISVCLHTAALISPAADRNPELAWKINYEGSRKLVEAIEAQDPENTRMVTIGSVAQYGDRNPPLHRGRTGDPMTPSVFDHYALSKIAGELAVMQSRIRYRVSLRQTFIMIPDLFSLKDPIMFHQPLNSFMENITARDAGRMLAACAALAPDSDFWGKYYNISGGPDCRTTYFEFLGRIYGMLGLRPERVMERSWFALKNFHMHFFRDAERLNAYLGHWDGGQSQEDFYREVWRKLPVYLKWTARACKNLPPFRALIEGITRGQLRAIARMEDGPLFWREKGMNKQLEAFFGSSDAMDRIPGWGEDMPDLDHEQEFLEISHGYDEDKLVPDSPDLQAAAKFRGGSLTSEWNGDMHSMEKWSCCMDHEFAMTPHAVLKGGHWCPECLRPPWNYREIAAGNPFAAQILEREIT